MCCSATLVAKLTEFAGREIGHGRIGMVSMRRLAAAAAIMFGAVLTVVGAAGLLQEARYNEASARLNTLIAGAASPLPDPAPERFKFVDGVTTSGEIELDVFRTIVPDDELAGPVLSEPLGQPDDKYVIPAGRVSEGDGTAEAPWSGLQFALERLKPGDRLIVIGGDYQGPFAIGSASQDGTPDNPITIVFNSNALLTGVPEGEICESAVLTVGRSHWMFQGITITPQFCDAGMRFVDRVDGSVVESPHIFGGVGSGIVVADTATNIQIVEPHLHHLGSLEGKDKEAKRRDRLMRDEDQLEASNTAAIWAPESGVTVSGGKIHNHFGPIVVLVDAAGLPLQEAQARERLSSWGTSTAEGQEKWW